MPNGIEDIAALLPRAPQQVALKDYGQIQAGINDNNESVQRQQVAAVALQNAKRAQRDQDILQKAIMTGGGDWDKTLKQAVQDGISPNGYYGLQDQRIKLRKAGADASSEETKAALEKMKLVGSKAGAYLSLPPDAQSRNEADLRQALEIPDDQPIDLDKVRLAANSSMLYGDQLEEGRKQSEETRKQQQFNTEQPVRQAEIAPKVAIAQATADDPGLLNPGQRATADQAAANAAATANNQAAVDAREQERIKLERSRIGLEQSKNAREQAIYNQTYGAGSNDALRAVDPKLRVQASSAAQKAANEYQTAAKAGEDIQTLIDAARNGNKQAGTNLPLVGVEALNALQGIKRINRAEIDQYQGAGSLLDKIQGRIQGLATGQPIPADVLADIESLHKTLTGNALKAYNDKLGGINQNYHSDFKPVPSASAPSKPKIGDVEDGHVYLGGNPADPKSWKVVK